jgi:hypothetical protein
MNPTLSTASGQARLDATVIPATPHQAYAAALAASRCGEDFSSVVHWALLKWPLDGLPELAELIASASLGYWTDDGRDES